MFIYHLSSNFVYQVLKTRDHAVEWTLDKMESIFCFRVLIKVNSPSTYSVWWVRTKNTYLWYTLFPKLKKSRQYCASILEAVDECNYNLFSLWKKYPNTFPHTCCDSWKLYSGHRVLNFSWGYLSGSRIHVSHQLIQGACFFLPTRS